MVFEQIRGFFRSIFGNGETSSIDDITIWMPIFVKDVEENTEILEAIITRLDRWVAVLGSPGIGRIAKKIDRLVESIKYLLGKIEIREHRGRDVSQRQTDKLKVLEEQLKFLEEGETFESFIDRFDSEFESFNIKSNEEFAGFING